MAMAALQRYSNSQLSLSHGLSGSVKDCACSSQSSNNVSVWFPITKVSRNLRIQRKVGLWRARVGEEQTNGTQESATSVASEDSASTKSEVRGFGSTMKTVEKKKSSKSSAPRSVRRAPPSQPLIGVQPVDEQAVQIETAIVGSLAFLFVVILFQGIALAASGFLPEEWDQFIVNFVYPSFSPTVGVFLFTAAGYGLWKYLGGGPGTK